MIAIVEEIPDNSLVPEFPIQQPEEDHRWYLSVGISFSFENAECLMQDFLHVKKSKID